MKIHNRQAFDGIVVTDRMDKTVVVQLGTFKKHPKYKKYIRKRKTLKAHDEKNMCVVGDKVRIVSTRPLSKDKHWRVVSILEKRAGESLLNIEDTTDDSSTNEIEGSR